MSTEEELLPKLAPGLWPRDLDIELFNSLVDHKPIGTTCAHAGHTRMPWRGATPTLPAGNGPHARCRPLTHPRLGCCTGVVCFAQGISRHFRMVAIYDHLHRKQPNLTSVRRPTKGPTKPNGPRVHAPLPGAGLLRLAPCAWRLAPCLLVWLLPCLPTGGAGSALFAQPRANILRSDHIIATLLLCARACVHRARLPCACCGVRCCRVDGDLGALGQAVQLGRVGKARSTPRTAAHRTPRHGGARFCCTHVCLGSQLDTCCSADGSLFRRMLARRALDSGAWVVWRRRARCAGENSTSACVPPNQRHVRLSPGSRALRAGGDARRRHY